MRKGKSIFVVAIVMAAILVSTAIVPALPTADVFGIEDAGGYKNTYVEVPVFIANTHNGTITSIIFDIEYDNSVILVTDAETGDLTSFWDTPAFNSNFDWGTRVSLVYDGEHAIEVGSSGSVATLNFSVIGDGWSSMELNDIQLAGPPDYQLGTAPPKNGLFSVLVEGSIAGKITDNTGSELNETTVTLISEPYVTSTTDENGTYRLSKLPIGEYCIEFSKPGYWTIRTNVTIISGHTTTMNLQLPMKGDLNNNGMAADAGDLSLMKDASVGKIGL